MYIYIWEISDKLWDNSRIIWDDCETIIWDNKR